MKHLTRHLKFFFLSLFLGVLFTNCSPFHGQVYNSSSPSSQNSDQSQQQGDGTSDSQTNLPIPAGASAPSPSSYSGTFFTLHRHPITFVKSSALDPQGQLTFVKTEPLVGFQKQFPPSGTPGCVMGYPEYRNECDSVNGGFGFTLEGLSYHTEYRVYVPAGTTFFGTSGYLPQSVQYAVAVRIDQPPLRKSPLTNAEYEQAKSSQHKDYDFAKILAGEERLMVHDGGGNISLTGIARLSANPLARGRWIYIRVLNGSYIHGLGAIYEVDRNVYKTEFYKIPFTNSGDPE